MAKKTEPAAEEKKNVPSSAMMKLFSGSVVNPPLAALGIKRRNLPQMVKPGDVPVGGVISAVILDAVKSPVSTVKGSLLWLKLVTISPDGKTITDAGTEITFPCTGVIRAALLPGSPDDSTVTDQLKKQIGLLFIAKRTEDKVSQKFKKNMFVFEVFTSDKVVKVEPLDKASDGE